MKRRTILFTFVVLLLGLMPVQISAGTLLVDQVTPYSGYGYGLSTWSNMTSALNSAFGAANITVSTSPLTSLAYMLGFDALWITARSPGDPGLSATESANVQAFIATGRRVALIGENGAWAAWDNSILATVGGSYSNTEANGPLSPVVVHPITAGVTASIPSSMGSPREARTCSART